ncbi:ectonucleotide pyrophosphatase/phosphodiesterase [Bacteroidota bacterium]
MKRLILTLIILTSFLAGLNAQSVPYVLLISFDGFRWDYVHRGITPNLEKMKENGVSALSLRPAFPSKTFPNHLAIITGMYPENHGIIFNTFLDPFSGDYYSLRDTNAVRGSKWYWGEAFWETAERQGITTASYFWPGSELPEMHRRPTLREAYDHDRPYEERVEGVINWLQLPQIERPHFITLYFHDTDSYGHEFGPYSEKINQSIQRLDNILGLLYDKLSEIEMQDSVNVIVVSDHGMTELNEDRVINIGDLLTEYECRIGGSSQVVMIDPSEDKLMEVYSILKENENHYKVYLKEDVPDYYHFSKHPYIYRIVIIAETGWIFSEKDDYEIRTKGDHGYDNHHTDMHGIFIADGPDFKDGYQTGTVWNIDIYSLLCKIFNITPSANIDAKLERIGFVLK